MAAAKTIAAKAFGKSLGHEVEGFINLNNFTPGHAAFTRVLFETQFGYVPKQYCGRVLICAAKTTKLLTHLRQLEGPWRKVAPNSQFVQFKGTHTSIMKAPDGVAVADYLARQFTEIDTETKSWPMSIANHEQHSVLCCSLYRMNTVAICQLSFGVPNASPTEPLSSAGTRRRSAA